MPSITVDCAKCNKELYEDDNHIDEAFKYYHDKEKNLFINYCRKCFNKAVWAGEIETGSKIYKLHCNDEGCKFYCEIYNGNVSPFWKIVT